jgi:hypothetical protein
LNASTCRSQAAVRLPAEVQPGQQQQVVPEAFEAVVGFGSRAHRVLYGDSRQM